MKGSSGIADARAACCSTTGAADRPSRRAVLTAGLLLPLAACSRASSPEPPRPPDPDVALVAAAVERERTLIALYDGALAAARPVLAPAVLLGLRAEHATHLAALTSSASTAQHAGASTASPRPALALPASPALVDLEAAETAAATAHAQGVLGASRALAQLLASLSAAEAAHVVAWG